MTLSTLDIILAGLNVDGSVRDAVVGDLLEERVAVAACRGERHAERWMRRQIALSTLAFLRAVVCDGGARLLVAVAGAAIGAMVAVGLVIGVSSALWFALLSPETIARLTIVALAIDLAFGTAGGYLAARLGQTSPLGAAFAFGVLGVLLMLLSSAPGAYASALEVLLVPATLTGGWLRARHLARRTQRIT